MEKIVNMDLRFGETPASYNNFYCRYCNFYSGDVTAVLLNHYKEEHPVTIDIKEERQKKFYQAGELIATVGFNHNELCCKFNCKGNSAKNKKSEQLCIRLKWGGDYKSIDHYFSGERRHFDSEKGVFMCFKNFEESINDSEENVINWIIDYGCALTFKLKFFEEIKNHNLIVLYKTGLPKHIRVKREIEHKIVAKCEVTPDQKYLIEENQRLILVNCELVTSLSKAREENAQLILQLQKYGQIKEPKNVKMRKNEKKRKIEEKNEEKVIIMNEHAQ